VLDGFPSVEGRGREPLTVDDPRLWPMITESIGHDPRTQHSALAALGPAGLAALALVFASTSGMRGRFDTGVFDGPMGFVAATEGREEPPTAAIWDRHARGGVECHTVDCAHGKMTQPEPLRIIAGIIGKHLDGRPRRMD